MLAWILYASGGWLSGRFPRWFGLRVTALIAVFFRWTHPETVRAVSSNLRQIESHLGRPFDPLMVMAHRRLERRMIGEYEATLDTLLDGLSPDTYELAIEIAGLPETIRGFADVKEQTLEDARAKQAELLASFSLRTPA